jgi:hypothetical protein
MKTSLAARFLGPAPGHAVCDYGARAGPEGTWLTRTNLPSRQPLPSGFGIRVGYDADYLDAERGRLEGAGA